MSQELGKIVNGIRSEMERILQGVTKEESWVTKYGAFDIHPRHLVFWLCVQSDRERDRLKADAELRDRLRQVLVAWSYPAEGRDEVYIGFESQETVDRLSGGNWWHHFK